MLIIARKRIKYNSQAISRIQSCFFFYLPSPRCPSCGKEYLVKGRSVEEIEGELIEVKLEQAEIIRKEERKVQGQAKTLPELMELGRRKGVKNPAFWARKIMEGRKRA